MRFARVAIVSITFLSLFATLPASAREPEPLKLLREQAPEPLREGVGERVDTLFLFAASGPGSYGSPGTDTRGFTFDHAGGPAEAGWFGVDLSAQEGEWWHVADTGICAGTGTDMSAALPFDPGDTVNDYALWCGRQSDCATAWPGYGNNWSQYAVIDLSAYAVDSELTLDFAYRSDFEGETWDWFELRVDSAGKWVTVFADNTTGDQTFREFSLSIPVSEFGGPSSATRAAFYFRSDGAWSDEDGLYDSDVGAVWLDNFRADVDGNEVFAADFEDGLKPSGLSFEATPGAGDYAELRRGIYQDDYCIYNASYMWTFFDPTTTDPRYPVGVIPYGPPYVDNVIEAPLFEVDHNGDPFVVGAETDVFVDMWVYYDNPLNSLVFFIQPGVAAWREEESCFGSWSWDTTIYYYDYQGWANRRFNMSPFLHYSAEGSTITAFKLRAGGAMDLCEFWCDLYGDGTGHTPAPYVDNISVYITTDGEADWDVGHRDRLQDNFPGPTGRVRIDSALDIQPAGSASPVAGDSTVLGLTMIPHGGVGASFNAAAGEMRPDLELWWRIIDGPHQGLIEAAQADPDDSDGAWSPWVGSAELHGETWGVMQADSTTFEGQGHPSRFAFDFNDDYFLPGDMIQFFYRAEAVDGTVSAHPAYALSSDPDLRNFHIVRCLPSGGATMLLVEDDTDLRVPWEWAFQYDGCASYDIYSVQASVSGQNNGLGCRAEAADLAGYEMIIWDSGDLPAYTLNVPGGDQLCADTPLLEAWLNESVHDCGLWVMGNEIASDLDGWGSGFLAQVLGAQRQASGHYYVDETDITVPLVLATHPDLEYLGGIPTFWANGGCPRIQNFDLVASTGAPLVAASHHWQVDPGYDAVAGLYNRDPDGNGGTTNAMGFDNRVLFNPFSYDYAQDDGYGVPAGILYVRAMVWHITERLLGYSGCWGTPAGETPAATALHGVYPNPFNPSARIKFSLAAPGQASLRIYDLSGRRVRTLVDGFIDSGQHELEWHGVNDAGARLASGIYLLRFESEGREDTRKLVLVK